MKTYTYEEVLDMCRIAVALDRETRTAVTVPSAPIKDTAPLSDLGKFHMTAHPPAARKRRTTKPK